MDERTLRLGDSARDRVLKVRQCHLVVVAGDGAATGARFRLDGRGLQIGNASDNDVVLQDRAVSQHHALVEDREEGVRIKDLGSTNGTWVNGVRTNEAFLAPGVSLRLGSTVLRVEIDQSTWDVSEWKQSEYHGLVGKSLTMRQLFGFLDRLAPTDLTVLLLGETGTGKEEVARAIHKASPRGQGPLVVFDGSATEPSLMGATLFGQKEGAFTGAVKSRDGSFQSAHGGTLFIDEVGEIPLDLQPKLLRALERREVQPLGSDQVVKVDVRVVAATHRDLQAMVMKGTFRQDLYYRLSGVVLELPPLRERRDDVPLLAERFLQAGGTGKKLARSAYEALMASDWPGNVRELKSTLERASLLSAKPQLEASDLTLGPIRFTAGGATRGDSEPMGGGGGGGGGHRRLDDVERETILDVLRSTDWNITLSADILGITRQTLRNKLNKYGIRKPGEPEGSSGADDDE